MTCPTVAAVCADLQRRAAFGEAKYGVTVHASTLPLDAWLQHAYEEALDMAVYLKRAMADREALQAGDDGGVV